MRRVVCAALVVALAGCAAPEAEPEQAEASAPLAAPSAPGPSPEEKAVNAYLGMMGAVVEASLDGAEDHPDLELYARGQALELATGMLDGAKAMGEPVLRPEVTDTDLEADPASIMVEDCMDNTEWVIEGFEEMDPEERNTRLFQATVTDQQGKWKVDELWLGEFDEC
ncbi:hypothetical protein NE857_26160 [Nocardiopsis exhalans]|uniref:Lipoprotein n=2 Tax=Nocardiopsis TaxID=2013 RepID=A0A840WH02_9ACTN|nr:MULTISPECIES: hypothetical protein [Nocardiopsis]MBB5492281.1 hypothetical protein [Nocardiopsis metallicus]USY18737.1 hypothetical protein NE857_26160 [Nocardiopsis exhalans]